jgi:hypothetical protein
MRLAVASLVLAAALSFQGAASAGLPTIYVNYTMNCTFGMTDAMGKSLTSIAPGNYQILVTSPVPFASVDLVGINDMTACKGSANFQLTGPGVSLTTTMDDGDSDSAFVYATFQPSSTYTAVDTTQPSVAHLTFTTTATGTASAPPTTPASTTAAPKPASGGGVSLLPVITKIGTLTATVSSSGGAKLTRNGNTVTVLGAGTYKIAVTDRSKSNGFVLEHGTKKPLLITGVAFVGKRQVSVKLTKGEWSFYLSGTGAKTYFTVA